MSADDDCTVGCVVWLFFQGWLAAPLIYLLPLCVFWPCFEGLQSWLGGLASLLRFCFVLVDGQYLSQRSLLFSRLGLMPCSAWSKNKTNRFWSDDIERISVQPCKSLGVFACAVGLVSSQNRPIGADQVLSTGLGKRFQCKCALRTMRS